MNPETLPLHLLRPHALWLLCALPLAWAWLRRRRRPDDVWQASIDPHLRPHVLETPSPRVRGAARWPLWLAWGLAVLALSGPAWRRSPQPVWQNGRALVVALDLSSAVNADDIPPSRLLQARAKLRQLIEARPDGQIGLIAYADDAHVVTPLTEDGANVALFIDALSPEIMPVDGRQPARAIERAVELLRQGGAGSGEVLLLTDAVDAAAHAAARRALAAGYRVSALGVGSANGGEVRGRDGELRTVRLDAASLQALAAAGGGRYAELAADTGDLHALGVLDPKAASQGHVRGQQGHIWQDEGYWLLLPVLLLALWGFRRRAAPLLLVLVLAGGSVPLSLRAQAQAPTPTQRDGWWLRADQQQHRWMEAGHRAYRAGDYARAAAAYARSPEAHAQYNLGNALAKAGRYDEAIAAYDRALARAPRLPDARENRAAVERARQRKPPAGDPPRQHRNRRGSSPPDNPGPSSPKTGPAHSPPTAQTNPSPASPAPRDAPSRPSGRAGTPPPEAPDAAAQRAAEQAQRARMQRELEAARTRAGREQARQPARGRTESQAEREQREAVEAWLRRVPDTPGDWLRQKFWIEYQRRRMGEEP